MPGSTFGAESDFYEEWQRRGVALCPFVDGAPRLRATPHWISTQERRALYRAATHVYELYEELADVLACHPDLLTDYFGLTETQRALWMASAGAWHTLARADLFFTTEGRIVACELNSDTPSGMDEAWLLGDGVRAVGVDPNRHLARAFVEALPGPRAGTVGIVYPTDLAEDEPLMGVYRRWIEASGRRTVTGAPANLDLDADGFATLFGQRVDVVLRHYKSDWWCERLPLFRDLPGPMDARPLTRELACLIRPLEAGKLSIVNPLGAIASQNKISLAFFHDHQSRFSPRARELIARHLPTTRRLCDVDLAAIEREQGDWVLKSDYGCEGAEVVVGRDTPPAEWRRLLRRVLPSRWVVQSYFEVDRRGGDATNYGVFLIAGRPCGLYLRASSGPTDASAHVVPVVERVPLGLGPLPGGAADAPPPARLAALLDAYTPGGPWRPFMKMLVAFTEDAPTPFAPSEAIDAAADAGRRLAAQLRETGDRTLVVCDLPGPESVAFGVAMAGDAEPIVQVENVTHTREVVPLRETLSALDHFAPTVRAAKARGAAAHGVVILERRRLQPPPMPRTAFDNRHWAWLPAPATLESLGVRRIVYVHPVGEDRELDDLNEDFARCEQHGIPVLLSPLGAPLPPSWDARRRVVRRPTALCPGNVEAEDS